MILATSNSAAPKLPESSSAAPNSAAPKLSDRRQVGLVSLGILVAVVVLWGARCVREWSAPSLAGGPAALVDVSVPEIPAIDVQMVRERAWVKIQDRLDAMDAAATEHIDASLLPVHEFFNERRKGCRPFAAAVLSLGGKWAYIKSRFPYGDGDGHVKYLQEQFSQHLFTPEELNLTLQSAVKRYVAGLRGLENQLLVHIRADLSDGELPTDIVLPALADPKLLEAEFQSLLADVARTAAHDTKVVVTQTTASLVGGELAALLALRVATGVAARMGVSAGIIGTGATAGWVTFGAGLVAAIIVDQILDYIISFTGYDPETQVTAKVGDMLERARLLLIYGDSEAAATYAKLRQLEQHDPDPAVRTECGKAADRIDASGNLGLRRELVKLNDERRHLRRLALRRLILEGSLTGAR